MPGVALVLGGGGLVGHAWHVGVLAGLADGIGWDARGAQLIVGTSAGAVVGAELRAGLAPRDLLEPGVGAAPTVAPRPGMTRRTWRCAAPGMVARSALPPWRARPGVIAAGLLPRGRRDPAIISDAVSSLYGGREWPADPLWVCVVRLDSGRRVILGAGRAPACEVGTAVAASCAMAGFFAPVPVGDHEYVDGGARSATNADLVAGGGFDVVVVSSPMSLAGAAGHRARPSVLPALGRLHRRGHSARLRRELRQVRSRGALVAVFEPDADDLAVMGGIGASMEFARRSAVSKLARDGVGRRLRATGSEPAAAALVALATSVSDPS